MPIQCYRQHIKKLHRLARRKDIDLWFEDECHFQQHGSRCAMWIPPEDKDPVVLHAPTRKQVPFFGAVSVHDGRFVYQRHERFNAETFQCFLMHLLRHRRRGRILWIVLDNASWHHARALRPWLRAHRSALRLDFLPAYSPELNGIERVWKLTRYLCTHNQHFETLEVLLQIVTRQFLQWHKPNRAIKRLCAIK